MDLWHNIIIFLSIIIIIENIRLSIKVDSQRSEIVNLRGFRNQYKFEMERLQLELKHLQSENKMLLTTVLEIKEVK